mgnify:FL=1
MPNWTKEQEDAIYKDNSNIIVSAGAGSGKTAVLSERVLRKLKSGVSISNLLILTFTKAAAHEMKERIKSKIKSIPELKDELLKVDSAYITTFDSYALSIVKKYGYLINVSSNCSIIEKSIIDIKKMEFMDSTFMELYENKDPEFLKFIDTFCTKDDKQIKSYMLSIISKLDLIYNIYDYLDNYLRDFYAEEYINNSIKEYEELLIEKIGHLNKLFLDLEEYVEVEYYEKLSLELSELLLSDNYNSIKQNIKTIPQLPKNSLEEAKKIKEEMSSIIKELTMLCEYSSIDDIKNIIYKTKENVSIIIKIVKKFNEKINDYKFSNDVYEFLDIAKMSIKILEQNEDIRNDIKNNLNEILIDEYQDTSDLQDLFISYIENNNCYMVGDIKQSIYRFRNANPNLFKNKYDKYTSCIDGIKIDLNKNFRSRSEVLNNINLVFDDIMTNMLGGADYKKSHRMVFGNSIYDTIGNTNQNNNMEFLVYDYNKDNIYKKEEIEIFIIANDIKNKIESGYKIFDKDTKEIRNIKYSDIAILLDRSTNFSLYKKIFEYLNIPLSIYKDEVLTNNTTINIIKNIIYLMINSNYNGDFKYSFISVLRSYLFNMDDNLIFEYFDNKNFNDCELIKKVRSIDFNSMSLSNTIIEIINSFNFYEKIITVGNVSNHIVVLDNLIAISKNLENLGYDIYSFYDYLNKILEENYEINYPVNLSLEGVKIMTIHKSKGLEFNICYFASLYSKFNKSDLKERFLFDNKYGFITPIFDNGIRSTIYKELLKRKYLIDEISEKIRLFYVALTRAKEKMIMVMPQSFNEIDNSLFGKLKYSSFLDMISSIVDNLKPYFKHIDLEKINLSKNYNFIKQNNYKEKIDTVDEKIKINDIVITSIENEDKHFSKINNKLYSSDEYKNTKFGTLIHSIFENIDFDNPQYNLLDPFIASKIKKFIETNILKDSVNLYKEYEFMYEEDNVTYHGIIDLLIEYKDCFKIVDYKLKNVADEAYINQLNGYKKYIENLTGKKVYTYLYSIIDEKLVEL